MPLNGIDPSAKTPARLRRDMARLTKGAAATTLNLQQPIALDSQDRIILNVATNGGLTGSGTALSIKLDTNPGLTVSASGLKLLLSDTSLALGTGGVSVNLASNSGLVVSSGLKINLATGAPFTLTSGLNLAVDGSTIEINSSAIRVKDAGITGAKLNVLTTKGDVLVYGTSHTRLPVGTDGQVLTADSSQTTGLKWATASSSGGATTLTFSGGGGSGVISTTGWTVTVDSNGSNLSNAIDGNTGTAAVHTSCNNGSWFKFDMAATYAVSAISFTSQASTVIPTNYKIEFSTDNSTWTTISASSAAIVNFTYTLGSAVNARYIRITADSGTANGSWFCNEFTATGTAAGSSLIAGTPTASSAAGSAVRIAGVFAKASSGDDFGINFGDASANGYRAVWTSGGVFKLQKVISGTATDIGTSFTLASDTSQHYFDMQLIVKASNSVSVIATIDGVSGIRVDGDSAFDLTSGANTVTAITDSTGNMLDWGITVTTALGGASPARQLTAGDLPGGKWITATNGESVLASTFSVTAADNTYQDTGLGVALPVAGTYIVYAVVRSVINCSTLGGSIIAKLVNNTASSDIANSEVRLAAASVTGVQNFATAVTQKVVTVTGASTIELWAERTGGGTYTESSIPSSSGGRTLMGYYRIA